MTAARRREESWEVIGKAARVSRQAAHQRFSKVLLPTMAEPPTS
ncbi:hypothetical protein ACFQ2K_52835 [Streptomyces sanglieri]|uniref:Uncharacterized protein n=1 Tax=Streptomyces sanglieri TaxID=193460 RepID=A0ABW2WJN6_9ACTN